jgi:hypothetical protein
MPEQLWREAADNDSRFSRAPPFAGFDRAPNTRDSTPKNYECINMKRN